MTQGFVGLAAIFNALIKRTWEGFKVTMRASQVIRLCPGTSLTKISTLSVD